MTNQLSEFEQELFTILTEGPFFEFDGDISQITPAICRNAIQKHEHTFEWDDTSIRQNLSNSALPSFLASAIMTAWNQVDWDRMCDRVRDDLLGHTES